MSLKNLILNKKLAYRKVSVHSDDFDADFIVYEPNTRLFIEYANISQKANDITVSDSERDSLYNRARELEIDIFINCVCGPDGEPVLLPEDKNLLLDIYGQSHSRIITTAFEKLSIFGSEVAVEDAKKN